MVSKQQFKYIVDKSTNCELSESLTQHRVYDKSTDASRKQYHENSLMLHHPPFKQSHCSTCCFCRDQHGQQGQKLLCRGTHTDWQFAIHFGSANSRQNQTTSFTSWTVERTLLTFHLPCLWLCAGVGWLLCLDPRRMGCRRGGSDAVRCSWSLLCRGTGWS